MPNVIVWAVSIPQGFVPCVSEGRIFMLLWKDPKGNWRYQFQHLGQRHSKTGFRTKAEARSAQEANRKSLADPPTPPSSPTPCALDLENLMVEYLRVAERQLAPKTLEYRKIAFRRFLGHARNIPTSQVTTRMVENYLLSRPTNHNFNKDRTELLRLFNWGFKRLMVQSNPVALVDKLPVDTPRKVIPTPEQMVRMLVAAGPERPLLLVLFHTMARIDEVLRLRWEDVNFEQKAVRLWTRKRRGGSWEFDWMPMNEDLEKVLWGLWQKRKAGEWVFVNSLTNSRYKDRFKLMRSICRRAGLPQFGYHTIRHFVASYLVDKKKVSLPVISRLLRHKNLQTTERYLQAIDPRFRDTMRLLEGDLLEPTHNLLTDLLTKEKGGQKF
jgi:integrase